MKWIKRIIIFICGIIVASCGYVAPHYYTRQESHGDGQTIIYIQIDREFTDQDRVEIDRAIMQWNYVLNGHVILQVASWEYDATALKEMVIEDGKYLYFVKVTGAQGEKLYAGPKTNTRILAFAQVRGTMIYIFRDRISSSQALYGIMMHEIAHIFGANHNSIKLMSPSYSEYNFKCVDYHTAVQVAKTLKLNVYNLNWCFDQSDL